MIYKLSINAFDLGMQICTALGWGFTGMMELT
jgi:hypothetical protein